MSGLTEKIVERQLSLFDDPGLSDAERQFADAYIANGFNGSAAYAETVRGTKSGVTKVQACKWLKKDRIRQYLRQRLGALADNAELTQAELIENSRKIIRIGMGEMTVRRTPMGKTGPLKTAMVFEPNLAAANTAIGFLGRVLGVDGEGDADAKPMSVHLHLDGSALPGPGTTDG